MKVIANIQARMGSQRLPNKALLKIQGRTSIEWIVFRLKSCRNLNEIILTTSDNSKDDVLEKMAERLSIPCFRGSETDLIQRHLGAARWRRADAVMRITADCPLVDPDLADRLIGAYQSSPEGADMVVNNFPPSFPHGLDLDIIPTRTLERLDREVSDALHREWLTTYILERPQIFRILNISNPTELTSHRWTLDYPEDLKFMRAVFRGLSVQNPQFRMKDILELVNKNPRLKAINENRVDKKVSHGFRSQVYHQLTEQNSSKSGSRQ